MRHNVRENLASCKDAEWCVKREQKKNKKIIRVRLWWGTFKQLQDSPSIDLSVDRWFEFSDVDGFQYV